MTITADASNWSDDAEPRADPAAFVRRDLAGNDALELMVTGAKCAACIRKIEASMLALPGVADARLNLSTQRLRVSWRPGAIPAQAIPDTIERLGYGARPFDPEAVEREVDETGRRLLRYLAVAAFGAMNIMMFSIPVWAGEGEMGDATRTLLHWVSALIAIPAALYAAQPFFGSAVAALKARHANMDVPISLAVLLTIGMSVAETLQRGEHAYFDGILMLLFFLLVGRYLDHRLRQRARTAARELLALQSSTATRIASDGALASVAAKDIAIGDRLLVAAGERVSVDGVIEEGATDLDCALLTGESMPQRAQAGDQVSAGVVNLTQQFVMRATARAAESAIAEMARLIETGEQGRAAFVRLADRAASLYVPVVHTLAALTFFGWMFGPALLRMSGFAVEDAGVREALQNAVAVLIITCPCALGLAVPAVQVVATGRLFKHGVLVRSRDALERLAQVDTIVFDKTGTLTYGKPELAPGAPPGPLAQAALLARASRHPLSRALACAAGAGAHAKDAREVPGDGVQGTIDGRPARLGRRAFVAPDVGESRDTAMELWFAVEGEAPVRFAFADALRPDAKEVLVVLKRRGYALELVSGDRHGAVAEAARLAGVEVWRAGASPVEKTAHLEALRAAGRKVLMVGDGLNDAAALAAAHASASPGTAVEASQAASDIVIMGSGLSPLLEALETAKAARSRALENLFFSALYNIIAAPLAAAGFLTPLIAAIAMSGSSMAVTLNALRLQLGGRRR